MKRGTKFNANYDPVALLSVRPLSSGKMQPNPHTHCLVSRGLWKANGQWIPVPYIDTNAAEMLFRHKILHFLKRKGLLNDERIELLDSFRHSGFSVDTSPTVWPQDSDGLERLGRYMLRCPPLLVTHPLE